MSEKEIVEFKTIDEILDFAVIKEEEAYKFYMEWAKEIEKASTRLVFEELAKDELKHKAFILRVKKGETLRPSPEEIVDLKISDYLAEAKPSANMDYQKALTVAMQREKESFKLYNRLAAMCKEEDIKSTFLALAQEEAKHKLRLEVIYDEDILKEN